MALKSLKISQATPLTKSEVESSNVLIPVSDDSGEAKNISVNLLKEVIEDSSKLVKVEYLEDNYYTKNELRELINIDPEELGQLAEKVEILSGDATTEGSVAYQINEAKQDLIGNPEDPSSYDTINATKNLVEEIIQFITYSD